MTSSRALVLESPHRLVPRSLPLPAVGADDGLLRVEACGLCGTDHEQWTGHLAPPFAFVPGHETVGIIEALGGRAAARWGVQVGDRVAVEGWGGGGPPGGGGVPPLPRLPRMCARRLPPLPPPRHARHVRLRRRRHR